jgi:hypothetical protein
VLVGVAVLVAVKVGVIVAVDVEVGVSVGVIVGVDVNVGVAVGGTHWVLVGSGYNPDGHEAHEVCPRFGWIVPSAHAVHALTLAVLLKVPGSQATQLPPNL